MKTDITLQFEGLRSASRASASSSARERRAWLELLRRLVIDHRGAIADTISQDFRGRSPAETELLEIVPLTRAITHAQTCLEDWMREEKRPVDWPFQPARAVIRYEPLGVIGIIAPWNYPLLLALGPLVDALAAGNRAMIKPSELTPRFSGLLASLVERIFAPDLVTTVLGGVEEAKAFAALPFDHLVFTGSTAVGRQIMRAAAENLTPVTLELGGKSPAIVCPGFPIDKAARSIAFGKFVNAGQTCIAPDYALVPAGSLAEFGRALLDQTARSYPTLENNPDYSSIVSEQRHARLTEAIEEARAGGAVILRHSDAIDSRTKIPPTVVLNAPDGCALMTEEIFGPILPLVGYGDLAEALSYVRSRQRPLALYCYASDARTERQVLDGTLSGGVTINGTLLHIAQQDLPFGGVGPSGMGAYHGIEGFKRFSHARAVHRVGAVNPLEMLGPPWGRMAKLAIRLLAR